MESRFYPIARTWWLIAITAIFVFLSTLMAYDYASEGVRYYIWPLLQSIQLWILLYVTCRPELLGIEVTKNNITIKRRFFSSIEFAYEDIQSLSARGIYSSTCIVRFPLMHRPIDEFDNLIRFLRGNGKLKAGQTIEYENKHIGKTLLLSFIISAIIASGLWWVGFYPEGLLRAYRGGPLGEFSNLMITMVFPAYLLIRRFFVFETGQSDNT